MIECTFEMRRNIESKFDTDFTTKADSLSSDLSDFIKTIRSKNDYSYRSSNNFKEKSDSNNIYDTIYNDFRAGVYAKPSEIFIGEINSNKTVSPNLIDKQKLLDTFMSNDLKRDYLYIIDKLNKFQYSKGWYRRSVRTTSYIPQYSSIFSILWNFCKFSIFSCNLNDYLRNQMSEEMVAYKYSYSNTNDTKYIIAAELDLGNTELETILEDIFLGENNVNVVSRDMICGIVMSDNEKMHKLLADFLLAARLQEGVRQSICETMDSGTTKAFYTLFKVIVDNNLIRFSAVKRAVATWIGICDTENLDRITQKIVDCMWECLNDETKKNEYLNSTDSIYLSVALWATGFIEVQDAISHAKHLWQVGQKVQKITAAFYIENIGFDEYSFDMAKSAFTDHNEDLEIIACCIGSYKDKFTTFLKDVIFAGDRPYPHSDKPLVKPIMPKITDLFNDMTEAKKHYKILWKIYNDIPKKELVFSPCIFPWNNEILRKNDILICIFILAYSINDKEELEKIYDFIPKLDSSSRYIYTTLLLYNPTTPKQRDTVISLLSDRESYTQQTANILSKDMTLSKDNYKKLSSMLKYKGSDTRACVLKLLYKQDDISLTDCVKELMSSKKEEVRTGGLDLLLQLSKDKDRADCYNTARKLSKLIVNPSSKEQILIDELCNDSESQKILNTKGYGLYNPDAIIKLPDIPDKVKDKSTIYNITLTDKKAHDILKKLDDIIVANQEKEYTDGYGNERLLGDNSYYGFKETVAYTSDYKGLITDRYPFPELWKDFYKTIIKDCDTLFQLWFFLKATPTDTQNKFTEIAKPFVENFFGSNLLNISTDDFKYFSIMKDIIEHLFLDYCQNSEENYPKLFETSKTFISYIIKTVPKDKLYYTWEDNRYNNTYTHTKNIFEYHQIQIFMQILTKWHILDNNSQDSLNASDSYNNVLENDKRFIDSFILRYKIDCLYDFKMDGDSFYGYRCYTDILDIVKACTLKLVPKDLIYKGFFELLSKDDSLRTLSVTVREDVKQWELNRINLFMDNDTLDKNNDVFTLAKEVYLNIVDVILKVELKRGDSETIFSKTIKYIRYLSGADRLVDILKALGNETISRSSYYYGSVTSKKICLSHLLSVSYPNSTDTKDTLKKYLKNTDITEKRLVEVAMYAPQWIDIIDKYLNWPGFTSGCYYFMAHMNDDFDGKKEAIIAKYTPISIENLKLGAFDINWFRESYEKLGEDRFNMIYDSAKYISDGIKHSRARKYADAALGKIDASKLATEIEAKRNKDSLMSYGIIPFEGKKTKSHSKNSLIANEKDLLTRYQFIQKFAKESKQFGSQRQASEKIAVRIAMENLAINAGFSDVTRLTLAMETKLIQSISELLEWKEVAKDVSIRIHINENGTSEIQCKKKEKMLKSLPSNLKKDEYTIQLKDVHKQLKEQYSRTKQMLEQSMEDGIIFYASEILTLFDNPVVKPLVENLIFISEQKTKANSSINLASKKVTDNDNVNNSILDEASATNKVSDMKNDTPIPKLIGYLRGKTLVNYENEASAITAKTPLRIAHCLDLYRDGHWHDYQKQLFDNQVKQPFKQVFRELYLKTDDERDKNHSLRYAGNQIQPKKTVACLKNRRWVADYEDGLQKVYYKENIVARIYALADWFSPSEVEAPTLEWVEFSDRKTYKSLKIDNIPDLIYSEVMRDVDLAVSVAHAGGVDPETSHSTVEMRKTIIEFNLPLFKLTNVTFEGSHALIKGTLASYSLHLGSGVIHQIGGSQINVLPVHSQSRGKLFLPFVDEDPKTAEIMSKVVLFAEDTKIKDPYILQQIHMTLKK